MKNIKTKEIMRLLNELKKEHKIFWAQMNDEVSPKIIDETIRYIKEKIK